MRVLLATFAILIGISEVHPAFAARQNANDLSAQVQRTAETQVRRLVEPLLDRYCQEECKLMSVKISVDLATPDEVSPGFDDVDAKSLATLAPSGGSIKLLIDEKVGPVSRQKLLDLVQQFLDTLDFIVRIDTQVARFPQPVGSAGKIAELRDKITKQFKSSVDDLFNSFCPEQCLLADYELVTELVNAEEAQYGGTGEFVQDSGVALRVKSLSATLLVDDTLSTEERVNVLEMAKLKTTFLKNVTLTLKSMKFPRPSYNTLAKSKGKKLFSSEDGSYIDPLTGKEVKRDLASTTTTTNNQTNQANTTDNKTANNSETNQKNERYEKYEKIERVENGDAIQQELGKFKLFGIIFACSIISLLIFVALATMRPRSARPDGTPTGIQRIMQNLSNDPVQDGGAGGDNIESPNTPNERTALVVKRYEIERIRDELMAIFAQHPKVAKYVFSRILTEEGVEITAKYIDIFGESVVLDMLRDPTLQGDMNELMEFYAKNPTDLNDDDKLELLKHCHNRTVAGKLFVMGSRSSNLFDFLADMDGPQISELVRNESLTVKSIVLTQCDPQKRTAVYAQFDEESRMKLLTELSRIDYLPRDYIFNVANALKRKRRENPKLNTEALPGSEVLLSLLERTDVTTQRSVLKNLELTNPESARTVKSKLVSIDTLRHLRDGQLLEVILSLRHDELIQFLKGAPDTIRASIFAKAPKDLVAELDEELTSASLISREGYQAVERKVLNRMKMMATEGVVNLVETNDRMLGAVSGLETVPGGTQQETNQTMTSMKKVSGW